MVPLRLSGAFSLRNAMEETKNPPRDPAEMPSSNVAKSFPVYGKSAHESAEQMRPSIMKISLPNLSERGP
ncbi:hypothetical protein SDC9_170991 [bioreactor metagenome]|uniref:Uncharacterized protein n=1 Tax=bioreactor metagenome TaxID=1076179 RepID=A0A645GCU4_9ZZZZ